MRSAVKQRTTKETDISASLILEGSGASKLASGSRMLDHLLQQFAFHSGCDLELEARSLDGIEHHLVEDVALTLGETLRGALDERRGIERYGSALIPMDDALVRVALDLSGRAYARTDLRLVGERIEDLSVAMLPHFFTSLASAGALTLHVDTLAGTNAHHCIEAAFKGLGRAAGAAWCIKSGVTSDHIPSTKGTL